MRGTGQRHTNCVEPIGSDFKFEAHFLRQAAPYFGIQIRLFLVEKNSFLYNKIKHTGL